MVKMTHFQFGQSSAGKISPKASWLIREAKEYVRLSFNKQRNEVTMLKEMIEEAKELYDIDINTMLDDAMKDK